MPITDEQREDRMLGIGSSDAPGILNLLGWFDNDGDIWANKIYGTDTKQSVAMRAGTFLEDGILDWFAFETGKKVKKDRGGKALEFKDPDGINYTHPDGVIEDSNGYFVPIDAKNSGLFSKADFGPATDDVPDAVNIQVHHQMAVLDAPMGYVAALLGGNNLKIYVIERNYELSDTIMKACRTFWEEYVVPRKKPPHRPKLDTLKYLRRQPEKIATITEAKMAKWRRLAAICIRLDAVKKAALADVLDELGDAEIGECPLGTINYAPEMRQGKPIRVPRFKAAKGI